MASRYKLKYLQLSVFAILSLGPLIFSAHWSW